MQKESLNAELWGRNAHIDRLQKEIENIMYGSAKEVHTVVFCGFKHLLITFSDENPARTEAKARRRPGKGYDPRERISAVRIFL